MLIFEKKNAAKNQGPVKSRLLLCNGFIREYCLVFKKRAHNLTH